MVVYRNGRPECCSTRNSKRTFRIANSKPNLKRLSALLIGGLGASLIGSPAVAQQAEPRQRSEGIQADRPNREARRKARRAKAGLDGWRTKREWEQYPENTLSKSVGVDATLVFSDDNPPLLHGDTFFWSKPAFADIDGDGDQDVFVGEYLNGDMVYYENTGSPSSPAFANEVASPFGISSITSYAAPTFADLDEDGDLDLFIGNDAGDIYYLENTDETGPPGFIAPQANPFGLTTVPGYYSTPAFADIDGDGDLDAFSGNSYGEIIYFENVVQSTDTAPTFSAPSTNPFGFTSVPSYSTPTFVDINGDGDLDAFVGDEYGDTYYFENEGDTSSPVFSASPLNTPVGLTKAFSYAAPAFADLNDDGDFDVMLGSANGFLLYHENTGSTSSPAFDPHFPFGIGMVDRSSSPTFADLDDDGDLDVLIAERNGDLLYFSNSGDPTNAAFASTPLRNPFGLIDTGTSPAPKFVDLDHDGLIDLMVGEGPDVFFFENVGSASAPSFTTPVTGAFGLSGPGNGTVPSFVDIDDDGDLDYFGGKLTSSLNGIFFQENTQGSASTSPPAFAAFSTNPFGLTGMPDALAPAFADVDGDGDFDLMAGGDTGDLIYFENSGSAGSPAFAAGIANPSGVRRFATFSRPAFADIDADGKFDLFSGMRTGRLAYYNNQTVPDPTAIIVSPKVWLEGPYSDPANAMTTGINSVLPLSQPYDGAEFSATPLAYAGTESVGAMPANVVDWVLVQIRTGTPPSPQALVDTRAAFLLSDGSVVDLDGSSPVSFVNKPIGDYHIVVFHRNHLGIMTLPTVALSAGNTSYDFTTGSSQAFGASPMTEVEAGVWGMFAGDANVDGQVTAADFNDWLTDTKAVKTGYQPTDFSLDAGVTATDFNAWLANTKAVASSKVPPLP